jgi:cardiolipin synthase (CMP-forming)
LSAARIAVAPYLFWVLWRGDWNAALLVILLAGISDGLDGFFARKFQSQSRLGEVLDPIGDKLLLDGSFLALAFNGALPWWLTGLVLGRDVIILAGAGLALLFSTKLRRFPPTMWGKSSTVAQISLVVAVVARMPHWLTALGLWIIAAFTLISGLDYAWRYTRN